jgi:hypothetical protein
VDEQGRYRWVHRRAGSSSGAATSTVMIEDGILVGGTFDSGRIWPALIDYESHLVWEEKWDMHHDLRPDGPNYFLFVGNAPKGTCPPDVPDSDALFRAERGSSEIVWNWQFCNHYIPLSSSGDWDHVNAVVPFPNGTALLFSARGQGALFKVDRDSGEIVWRMGKNGGFDFQGGTQRPFHKQHAPEFTADNRILLFDNGREPDLMRSGAVEIDFDEVGLTYKTVWSYYPDPPIFADIWGDADRLLNGNTLVTFGQRDKTLDSDIQEVTEDGEVVWHLSTPLKWGWYRADRVEPLPPGFFVE